MGTSNWQNIPYCIDVMMKIAPKRVLDVGTGFGRWGMLTREFCDVWFGRVGKADWAVELIGLEGYEPNVADYHKSFYNRVIVGDAVNYFRTAQESFNLIIFGDVLEHFDRNTADELLNIASRISEYVMINIPLGPDWPQEESYGNKYERHLSEWDEHHFLNRPDFVRHQLFQDYIGRPFGSFVLSREDPAGVAKGLFSRAIAASPDGMAIGDSAESLLAKAADIRQQLDFITQSGTWKMIRAVKNSPPFRTYARLRYGREWDKPYAAMDAGVGIGRSLPIEYPSSFEEPGEEELKRCLADLASMDKQSILAVSPRQWLGVSSSTRNLFGDAATYLPPLHSVKQASRVVEAVSATGATTLVLSGFAQGWSELCCQLHRRAPQVRVFCLWHGNLAQLIDAEVTARFYELIAAQQRGYIARVGCVKSGMAEVFERAGAAAGFICNYTPLPSERPPRVRARVGDEHAKVLALASGNNWRKNLYTQIAAAAMVPELELKVVPGDDLVQRFAENIGFKRIRCTADPVSPEEAVRLMAEHDLVLSVTLSECCPMTPLEAMAVGTPCLIGPTSHLFGDPFLDEMLVVARPDDNSIITAAIHKALAHRQEIIDAYWKWAVAYQASARSILERFLA